MALDQGTFFYWSQEFIELASELDIKTLEELRKVTNRLINDPDADFEARIRDFSERESEKWYNESSTWINTALATAYLRGVDMQDRELAEMVKSPKNAGNPLPMTRFSEHARITGDISDTAKDILSKHPEHWQAYSRFESTFKESVNKVRLPFRNSTVHNYRDIAALAQNPAFMEGARATRIDLAQDIINEFADRGINVVQFPSRHKMSIEAFAHRESRAFMQHTAVQGQINRATERGYDLVRINAYAGASPMCAPYQGKVFSLSGNSEKYPSLDSATFSGSYSYGGGLYHDYSYIKDMETYTNKGWKLIKDLTGSEQILSLNPETLIPEWSGISRLHNYHHKGKMAHLKGHSFDLCVTPDHDLFIGYSGRQGKKRVLKYKFEKAEKAIDRAKFTQLRIPEWNGKTQKVPINGINESDFARLLAWYISDGCCDRNYIRISKIKEPHHSILAKTLLNIGFKDDKKGFVCKNSEWVNYFKQFGKSFEKYLPEWIKENRQDIIDIFLDAYIIGDGTKGKSKFDGYDVERVVYSTTSKRLADDLGECIVKGGYYPSFRLIEAKGVPVKHHNGTYEGNHDLWHISRNKTNHSYFYNSPSNKDIGIQAELIDYDDKCYCVTLEKNHVLWVRRNGKTTWSGNCGHFQSTYIPGTSEGINITNDPTEKRILDEMGEAKGNRYIYEKRQVQRDIEYNIRKAKRRQAAGLTKAERERAQKSVRYYQAKQREHIQQYDFLKRNYTREAV